ncbi:AmmeMemoRadiSam system protein B [Desulfothermus okinawensis JCM 13304]
MERRPVYAGQFYPADKKELLAMLDSFFIEVEEHEKKDIILTMLPHAGYVFSGKTAGKTLSYAKIKKNVIILGPNHTGIGTNFSVWHEGRWDLPLGYLDVNNELSNRLLENIQELVPDFSGHLREHSLEVIIPFLWKIDSEIKIVPISIMEPRLEKLIQVGESIANIIRDEDVTLVVSSDMSHFISHDRAKILDKIAIDQILRIDPQGLYTAVRQNNISMCGIFPMTVGLAAAKALGAKRGELIDYTTSGEITGDFHRVVGYAGVLVY